MLRSARALWLFWTILLSYGWQWLLGRVLGWRRVAARLERVHQRNARRLAAGFTTLRGVYIKMGQVLSVLGSFLPRAYAIELEKLQDSVPARPFREIEERLREALGDGALGRFAEFEREPIAAASLAQVHRAVLHDGRQVAVKVLYPGIERLIRRDLAVLRSLLPVLRRLVPITRVERILDQLGAMLARETDYAQERRNMDRVRELFAEQPQVVVPTVVDELTALSVLTMSFEEGTKINDTRGLSAQGIEPEAVARVLVECYLRMLLEHRVFHADPHPGNFLVRPGPLLVMLDFGAVEEVTPSLAEGMQLVAMGALARSPEQILMGIDRMGFVARDGDRKLLERVGREYLAVLAQVRIDDFSALDRAAVEQLSGFEQVRGRLREVMRSVEYPDGYFYVERTLVLLFGLVGSLAPRKGLPGVAAPLLGKAMLRSFATGSSLVTPAPPPVSRSE